MINDISHDQEIEEQALGKELGVSRVTLWKWRRRGMPVLTQGRPGHQNRYNLAAVVHWLQQSGYGSDLRAGLKTGGRIQELARELSDRTRTPAVQTPTPGSGANAARASEWIPFDYKTMRRPLGAAMGIIFANSFTGACALTVHRHQIAADQAIEIHEDMLMLMMTAAADLLDASADADFEILCPDAIAGLLHPEKRSELIERIRAAAEAFREDTPGPQG